MAAHVLESEERRAALADTRQYAHDTLTKLVDEAAAAAKVHARPSHPFPRIPSLLRPPPPALLGSPWLLSGPHAPPLPQYRASKTGPSAPRTRARGLTLRVPHFPLSSPSQVDKRQIYFKALEPEGGASEVSKSIVHYGGNPATCRLRL